MRVRSLPQHVLTSQIQLGNKARLGLVRSRRSVQRRPHSDRSAPSRRCSSSRNSAVFAATHTKTGSWDSESDPSACAACQLRHGCGTKPTGLFLRRQCILLKTRRLTVRNQMDHDVTNGSRRPVNNQDSPQASSSHDSPRRSSGRSHARPALDAFSRAHARRSSSIIQPPFRRPPQPCTYHLPSRNSISRRPPEETVSSRPCCHSPSPLENFEKDSLLY